jgi:hypothetical protein
MARRRKGTASPKLEVRITPEQWNTAIQSKSGACLISDNIKTRYPHLLRPETDMATIRVTDPVKGVRYVYLTPPAAQQLLLDFDQGWDPTFADITIQTAVQIIPITRAATGPSSTAARREKRAQKLAELEAKVAAGEELTRTEKITMAKMNKPYDPPERPNTRGARELSKDTTAVIGGNPPVKSTNPNLLTGRNRHYGARMADPGVAFNKAVKQRVAEQLAAAVAEEIERRAQETT